MQTYRTIANRDGRGLSGHSMGGYGTVRIGMKQPSVFSSLYAMSSCCLMNNVTPARATAPRPLNPLKAGEGAVGEWPMHSSRRRPHGLQIR